MVLKFFIFIFCLTVSGLLAQNGFEFENEKNKITIPFQLINNLIFIPVTVNGAPLNFLLDTGVEETILISLDDKNEVNLKNIQKVKFKGLGSEEAIEGLKSSNNTININGFNDKNHNLYIVLDQSFNFSSHVGIPVNGIIGYHFFKNHTIKINYDRRKITVYKDGEKIKKQVGKRFKAMPISIERNKPYTTSTIGLNNENVQAKLLIDIGNSDAVWLFPNAEKQIQIPQTNFKDYLGKGFSGEIHGNRAKIENVNMGDFTFEKPIISFPDSESIKSVNMVKDRNGSIGGEILKRFTVIFNYPEKQIYLKKGAHFSNPFHYNMSGIEMQNEGVQWVQETVLLQTVKANNTFDGDGNKTDFKYKFSLKPVYTISNIRENSPAQLAGLLKDDTVLKINGTAAYKYSLSAINDILKSEEGKWITLEIERSNKILVFKFQLKSIL